VSRAGTSSGATPPASTEAILESISDGVFTVDGDWRITSFNRAAEAITGVPRGEALGKRCQEVFRANMCEIACPLKQTLATGKPVIGRSGFIVDARGRRIPISVSTALLKDPAGRVVGGAETFRDLSEVQTLRRELEGRREMGEMVSRSPAMRRIFEIVPSVAESPSTVLILGETGTGKELLARAIHAASPRRNAPFLAVHCGALPDTLLESELFGYKAGAFTGAVRDKPGRFALAGAGTLFLDEIGEVSPAVQIRLLRVLQERAYEPLGATRSETARARVIAATHRNLADEVRSGAFREDLYYRINVFRIEMPPLRHRMEDVPLLVDRFIERFNRLQGKTVSGIRDEAISLLMAHDWPGNVRELENAVERAFILCSRGRIRAEHLPGELTGRDPGREGPATMKSARDLLEARTIQDALVRHGYHREAAARALGLHKSTLFRKIRRHGIALPRRDGRHRKPDPPSHD
jgi:PAS domain S-box-containing protein